MRQATYTKKFIGFTALVDPDWDDEFAYDDILTTIARRGAYDCLTDYVPASFDNGNYPVLLDDGGTSSAHHLHLTWRNRYERQRFAKKVRQAAAPPPRQRQAAAPLPPPPGRWQRQAEEQQRAIAAALAEQARQQLVVAERAAEAERFVKLTDGVAMSEEERLDWLAYLHSNRGSV